MYRYYALFGMSIGQCRTFSTSLLNLSWHPKEIKVLVLLLYSLSSAFPDMHNPGMMSRGGDEQVRMSKKEEILNRPAHDLPIDTLSVLDEYRTLERNWVGIASEFVSHVVTSKCDRTWDCKFITSLWEDNSQYPEGINLAQIKGLSSCSDVAYWLYTSIKTQ